MTGTTIIDRDGRIRMPNRKVSKLTKDRYGLYLPTGLNELWEELRLRRARLLVTIQVIDEGGDGPSHPVVLPNRPASRASALGGQELGQNEDKG
jgi:hypothetical protein